MLLTELQTYSLTHLANKPFSSASSGDNSFSFITEKGLDILASILKTNSLRWLLCLLLATSMVKAEDVTYQMFGDNTDGLPAAFGDFNSDELTDIFVIRNAGRKLDVLIGQDKDFPNQVPAGLTCSFERSRITSVVPGDFNGDALMDVLVTLLPDDHSGNGNLRVVVLWGEMTHLNCTSEDYYEFETKGQPLAIDCDKNMAVDLFGLDKYGNRTFWSFNKNKTVNSFPMIGKKGFEKLRIPHSNAFLDLDNDNLPDLYITTEKNFEIWKGNEDIKGGFTFWKEIALPEGVKSENIGQTVFLDVESKGDLNQILPVCYDYYCKNSTLLVYNNKKWQNLQVNFNEISIGKSSYWRFPHQNEHQYPYTETITLRPGDYDMDGYPDLMTTLTNGKDFKSFLLKNVPCEVTCSGLSRTFKVQWKDLNPENNNTILGVFYDFQQDGVLDMIFVHYKGSDVYNVSAFKNTVNYDANFVKVMVVTGLTNKEHPSVSVVGPLRKSGKVYGTNLPGPRVSYETTTQEGQPRKAAAAQIPQSAHFSLHLPYTIFGLGRTPNFIEVLTVQVYGEERKWSQLIPNSQMVVIPWPIKTPSLWKVQLFVTPSKLITQSILALLATCVVISLAIAALYWKERKEDHLERLQEAHRFHFDAM